MDKKSFRRDCLNTLKKRKNHKRYSDDVLVLKKVEKVIRLHKPCSILLYMPMDIEVDLRKLIYKYRKKLNIFVPFIEGESFKMVKYRLPLNSNSFKIDEPSNSRVVFRRVDMIIVPVVGVDGDFKRVGFGKGMYDRFYEKLKNKPVTVFVQRKKCATKQVVTDSYDIHADYYITPKELMIIGKNNDNRDIISLRRCIDRRGCSLF